MKNTKIEWTDYTWNPVTGCTPISEGCQNCYAKRMSNRLKGRCGYPENDPFSVALRPERMGEPLKWKRPGRVFVCSMGDLFHDDVPDEFIARVWWVIGQCAGYLDPSRYRGHTFIILTKRPERMREWLKEWKDGETRRQWIESFGEVYDWMSGPKYWPDVFDNVWLGVTAENQQRADERIPILLQIPASVRFVSVEPMLGPVDLWQYLPVIAGHDSYHWDRGDLDWIICGGETGPGARPMHPNWVRSLMDQCQAAGMPYFFKSWGDWIPAAQIDEKECIRLHGLAQKGSIKAQFVDDGSRSLMGSYRVGKKKAGRIIDGRTWNEMPKN